MISTKNVQDVFPFHIDAMEGMDNGIHRWLYYLLIFTFFFLLFLVFLSLTFFIFISFSSSLILSLAFSFFYLSFFLSLYNYFFFKMDLICRHDCQDGSDEYACDFSYLQVNRKFM